jgi:hypothetical protein
MALLCFCSCWNLLQALVPVLTADASNGGRQRSAALGRNRVCAIQTLPATRKPEASRRPLRGEALLEESRFTLLGMVRRVH